MLQSCKKLFQIIIAILLLTDSLTTVAQDERFQYPFGLRNAYFGINIGYINYPFSSSQLEPGYDVEHICIPNTAVRVELYGLSLGRYFSACITDMILVRRVYYHNINGDESDHSVWMNIAGLSFDGRIPVSDKISIVIEAGLDVITRHGIYIDGEPVVANANYVSGLFGGALKYHLSGNWDLQLSTVWSPANNKYNQPSTLFLGAGFNYHMRPLSAEKLESNASAGYVFPHQFIIAGYSTNFLGYGVNDLAANDYFPIFWGGDIEVRQGFLVNYQRNVFHGRKVFAFDISANAGFWETGEEGDQFFTVSLNPVFRFYALHARSVDLFFECSLAGPTFISETVLDNRKAGEKFTFHDFMGIGAFAGKERKFYSGIRIGHYSNGNLFPYNPGIKIPLTFNVGYVMN